MEFVHRYVADALQEAEAIAEHCGRATVGEEDVRLALNRTFWDTRGVSPGVDPVTPLGFCPKPDKQMMQRLAQAINTRPLPELGKGYGLRVPPSEEMLTAPNYRVLQLSAGRVGKKGRPGGAPDGAKK